MVLQDLSPKRRLSQFATKRRPQDVSAIDPAPGRQSLIYTEMLKKIDELAAARESQLVAAANTRLARIFWEAIVFLLLILLVLACKTVLQQGVECGFRVAVSVLTLRRCLGRTACFDSGLGN